MLKNGHGTLGDAKGRCSLRTLKDAQVVIFTVNYSDLEENVYNVQHRLFIELHFSKN